MAEQKSEKYKSLTRRTIEEVYGKGNVQLIDQLIDRNFTMHDPTAPQPVRSSEDLKQLVNQMRKAFPDMTVKVEDLLVEGDKCVCRWSCTGTHKGEMMGISPSNQRVSFTGIDIFRFSNDKIVENWSSWDALGMMQQIGAIPELETSGTYSR